MKWIIDDFGRIYRSGARELTNSLGYTAGGPAVELYAIENIGHVGITERRGRVHIQCRPSIMSDKAIASLFYWLLDHCVSDVVISWYDEVWHLERPMFMPAALAFLGYLLERRSPILDPDGERFIARTSIDAENRWSLHADKVMSYLRASAPVGEKRQVLNGSFAGRWTLVDINLSTKHAVGIDQGDGYPQMWPGHDTPNKSFDFGRIGDPVYVKWLCANFMHIGVCDQPQFEDVDAIIDWPVTGLSRTRYWRIAIPVERRGPLCRLLSASGNDSSINLRPNLVQISA